MSKAKAEELGLTWIAEIGAHGNVAGPDNSLQSQPSNAINGRAAQGGPDRSADLDLIEINEAFAAVGAAVDEGPRRQRRRSSTSTAARSRSVTRSACPGARLALTLACELRRRGGGTGAAALCGGGGQGDALILRVPPPDRAAVRRRASTSPDLVERARDG